MGNTTRMETDIEVDAPFSLRQTLEFLSVFPPAGLTQHDQEYRAAHVVGNRPLLLRLVEPAEHRLRLTVEGEGVGASDMAEAAKLVRRIFSLTLDATPFYQRVGVDDPVIGELQRRFPGLRPVLFGSPFEALCWAIISQRISLTQATRSRTRLVEAFGAVVKVGGQEWQAFPSPETLSDLAITSGTDRLRLPIVKIERLAALAQRSVAGDLDADLLGSMPVDEARAWLERSPGVGPWASEFALIRGVGFPDLLPHGERRLVDAIQRAYDLDHQPSDAEIQSIAQRWSGFRSWATFLLRVGAPPVP